MDSTDAWLHGAATSDGMYDDVEMFDETGSPASSSTMDGTTGAVALVILSLVALWAMGAYVFKGSNQS